MEKVGAYEAKTHLPKLLERVMRGERIAITKHGVPIAVLQPFESDRRVDTQAVIEEIRRFRENNVLSGTSLCELIEEGRR
jgi:prevent-host-death family protein